jgi:uncharacterized membrane protein YcaP (DUF421 family)
VGNYSERLGDLVKGTVRQLVKDEEIWWDEIKKSNITKQDLLEGIRQEPRKTDLDKVEKAFHERSGEISANRVGRGNKEPGREGGRRRPDYPNTDRVILTVNSLERFSVW